MKNQEIIDYAYPCMMAERALKKAHDAMLKNDYDGAVEQALIAIAEVKLMLISVKEMKDIHHALREQTPSV